MKNLDFDLINKELIVKDILFDNQMHLKKFKSIGLFKGQHFSAVRIGNYNKMIGIKINNIIVAIRIEDANKIMVEEVKNNVTKTNQAKK